MGHGSRLAAELVLVLVNHIDTKGTKDTMNFGHRGTEAQRLIGGSGGWCGDLWSRGWGGGGNCMVACGGWFPLGPLRQD